MPGQAACCLINARSIDSFIKICSKKITKTGVDRIMSFFPNIYRTNKDAEDKSRPVQAY